jgi:hypothetical protein
VLAIGLLVADLVTPHSVPLLARWKRSAVRCVTERPERASGKATGFRTSGTWSM